MHFNNMNETTPEEFLTSMKYAFIEAAIQMATFLFLHLLLQRSADLPLIGIGMGIMEKNFPFFLVSTGGACLFFYDMFLQHHGVDVTFYFGWLRH
jgi:hypothetical protein